MKENNFLKEYDLMLKELGISSVDELFSDVPLSKDLDIKGMREEDVYLLAYKLSKRNIEIIKSLAGGGVYFHYIPAIVDWSASLPGFLTSYTPYQPEMSQGVLKMLYEFQSLMTMIFGLEVSNAGMYCGSTALAEAIIMAKRIHPGKKVRISAGLNPLWLSTVKTYLSATGIEYEIVPLKNFKSEIKGEIVVVQNPNFLGIIEDIKKIRENAEFLIVAIPDPIDVFYTGKPPADIVVAEGQPISHYSSLGGATIGIFVSKFEYIRKMPGRIIGKTIDAQGNTAYAMVLQTREQHIRRAKATSNICTSTSLLAIRIVVFIKYYGEEGLMEISQRCIENSKKLQKIMKAPELNFGKEFFTDIKIDEEKFIPHFLPPIHIKRIVKSSEIFELTGIKENTYLVAASEMLSEEDLEKIKKILQ